MNFHSFLSLKKIYRKDNDIENASPTHPKKEIKNSANVFLSVQIYPIYINSVKLDEMIFQKSYLMIITIWNKYSRSRRKVSRGQCGSEYCLKGKEMRRPFWFYRFLRHIVYATTWALVSLRGSLLLLLLSLISFLWMVIAWEETLP